MFVAQIFSRDVVSEGSLELNILGLDPSLSVTVRGWELFILAGDHKILSGVGVIPFLDVQTRHFYFIYPDGELVF